MEGFHVVRALRPARPNILIYFKDDILLCGNCAECVHYCMSPLNVLFVFCCIVCPVVLFHCLCSDAYILNCNECICLQLLGWCTPCYFFIALVSHTLGLHRFYPIRSSKYKDKDEGGGLEIPPHPMETDSVTTWHQGSVVIFGDEAIVGMLQRQSSQMAAHDATHPIKSLLLPEGGSRKSRVGVVLTQVRVFYSAAKAVYLLRSKSENEDKDMCLVSNDEGPAPSPSNRSSTDDWDE